MASIEANKASKEQPVTHNSSIYSNGHGSNGSSYGYQPSTSSSHIGRSTSSSQIGRRVSISEPQPHHRREESVQPEKKEKKKRTKEEKEARRKEKEEKRQRKAEKAARKMSMTGDGTSTGAVLEQVSMKLSSHASAQNSIYEPPHPPAVTQTTMSLNL